MNKTFVKNLHICYLKLINGNPGIRREAIEHGYQKLDTTRPMRHQRHNADQIENVGKYVGKIRKLKRNAKYFGGVLDFSTCSSLMATQELLGNPCSMGTKNWRQPDQWPMSSITQTRLKILMKTPNELKNWRFWVRNGDFQEFFRNFSAGIKRRFANWSERTGIHTHNLCSMVV